MGHRFDPYKPHHCKYSAFSRLHLEHRRPVGWSVGSFCSPFGHFEFADCALSECRIAAQIVRIEDRAYTAQRVSGDGGDLGLGTSGHCQPGHGGAAQIVKRHADHARRHLERGQSDKLVTNPDAALLGRLRRLRCFIAPQGERPIAIEASKRAGLIAAWRHHQDQFVPALRTRRNGYQISVIL